MESLKSPSVIALWRTDFLTNSFWIRHFCCWSVYSRFIRLKSGSWNPHQVQDLHLYYSHSLLRVLLLYNLNCSNLGGLGMLVTLADAMKKVLPLRLWHCLFTVSSIPSRNDDCKPIKLCLVRRFFKRSLSLSIRSIWLQLFYFFVLHGRSSEIIHLFEHLRAWSDAHYR